MLQIVVKNEDLYDEVTNSFIYQKPQKLQLEHSLVSVHKWESRWGKRFLSKDPMTREETIDYIKCMTITQNVPSDVYDRLSSENYRQIYEYIEAPMTATTFIDSDSKTINGEKITSELIYYWMIALNIPFECRKWHLNQLITLIKVINVKNNPPKKRSRKEILAQNAKLNEERKKKYNTKG